MSWALAYSRRDVSVSVRLTEILRNSGRLCKTVILYKDRLCNGSNVIKHNIPMLYKMYFSFCAEIVYGYSVEVTFAIQQSAWNNLF